MPVSHDLRCVFVHIPKTGGTSIEQALGMHGDWRIEDRYQLFGKIRSSDLKAAGYLSRFLQHLTMQEIRSVSSVVVDDYYSFSVVRNPWDRMVSVFSRPDPDMVEHAAEGGVDLLGLPFDVFLDRVVEVPHIHLLPQARFVIDPVGRPFVDEVYRFEALAAGFAEVCRKLGVDCVLPYSNVSAARQQREYRGYYTAETRALVAERYARDIELFGYEF